MNLSWDEYYIEICNVVASRSRCLSRKIGAVLVKDKVIIATGYNGPPRGVPHCEGDICPRRTQGFESGEGLHLCPATHAELNCILSAARVGVPISGASLYLNTVLPCKDCTKAIINAGISEVVALDAGYYDLMSGHFRKHSEIAWRTLRSVFTG